MTELKHRSRLTYAQLAARAAGLEDTDAVAVSTLKRAVDPRTVPKEHVVTAFVRACGAAIEDEHDVLKVWRAARAEDRGILAALRAPSVSATRTRADFRAALVAAYERAGAPPLRVLQHRAGTDEADGALLLPLTTAWRITRREGQGPANWTQCEAFLRGCGIHPRRMGPWQDAWTRTRTLSRAELGPTAADVRRTTRGGPDTLTRHDAARLAAGIRPVMEAIAADRARYDVTRLAAGIRPVVEAIAADRGIRNAPTTLAAGVQVLAEALTVMSRSASREAHRNGTTPPDWITATNLITHGVDPARLDAVVVTPHVNDDHGIDLITRTPDGRATAFQIKSHQQRPGPPPALPGAHVPEPPPPATAA
ncbi:hypothetical protein [Streptomyces sp. NRRL S-37]|uniref:hypothetical protein n=1 Tax=Streptomyces sp. NRRL S-37 TaxID=1463903 RepID=UPI00068B7BDE|nr:hypothetical protein [Streptomyces sp. NRRL S-37]